MATPTSPRVEVWRDNKYTLEQGQVFMTGIQALVRLPTAQRRRDRAAGLRTAGYVSGYQGSPLAAVDGALRHAEAHLRADDDDVLVRPELNEELALTAVSGTQYVPIFPGGRVDGVFGSGMARDRASIPHRRASRRSVPRWRSATTGCWR